MTCLQTEISKALDDLDRIRQSIRQVDARLLDPDNFDPGEIETGMSASDVLFAMLYGVLGAVFASSGKMRDFLERVHEDASVKNPKTSLGKLLHHFQDDIDTVVSAESGRIFVDRDDSRISPRFHRVMRGHDPFSVRSDNPFLVLTRQHGLIAGIAQVFRHLAGDTFSRQGLVLPFHSFFDYTRDGKLNNWLVTITEQVSRQGEVDALSAFNHLFTIHMQDILTQGLTWALCKAHIHIAGIRDEVRATQFRFTAYCTCFFTHAAIGMARQGGVPYIHWPAFGMMMKEAYQLFRLNYRQIKELERRTSEIVEANIKLERQVFATGASLVSWEDGMGYIRELERQDRLFSDLVDFMDRED